MSYQSEREQFLVQFGREFPNQPIGVALKLLRESSAEQRWNEVYSSFDIGEKETERQERKSERRAERVRKLAESIGCKLDTNGDPRGNPFCLLLPPSDKRMSIPSRGLPASAFR